MRTGWVIPAVFVLLAMHAVPSAMAQGAQPEGTAVRASPDAAPDSRPVFDVRGLRIRGYEIVMRTELVGIGEGLQVVVMSRRVEECGDSGLDKVTRMFILSGDRIEFDSFEWDEIGDYVEPGINSRTFFGLEWSTHKRARPKAEPFLVLRGTVPLQQPGESIRTARRTLVLSRGSAGFDLVADVLGASVPILGPTDVRVPLN